MGTLSCSKRMKDLFCHDFGVSDFSVSDKYLELFLVRNTSVIVISYGMYVYTKTHLSGHLSHMPLYVYDILPLLLPPM